MTDETRDIDRDGRLGDFLEEGRQRDRGVSIGPFDKGGDALAQIIFGSGNGEDAAASVRMNVDEARCNSHSRSIDASSAGEFVQVSDGGDGVAADSNVPGEPRIACAVEDLAVGDEQVTALSMEEQR